ncbi:MAG: HAMP domain-containing histidine kinase [Melioribacteraceae bacterium]|nr:HAMP domain-containing histidine kinase [Melioribacteraceae bacterium]
MNLLSRIKYELPDELESKFQSEYNNRNIKIIRITLLSGIIFYALFGFLDFLVAPEIADTFWLIRFAVVIPSTCIILAATFSKRLFKYIQPLMGFIVLIAGLGIVIMIAVAPPEVGYNYYAGIILVFILGYAFLNINFKWATISSTIIILAYEITIFYLVDTPVKTIINNNFFLLSANFIGMFAKLSFDYSQRKEYDISYKLDQSNKIIKENNSHLEERVNQRTAELKMLNNKLRIEIAGRKKIESNLVVAKEKAENANELKSEFLAQMSHEIRSPINVIQNFTYLIEDILDTVENEELDICFAGIDSASKRIVRTIDLILNTSELQLGIYEPTIREIDLASILPNLKKEYLKMAESKGLELKLNLDVTSSKIITDDYALNQIFANLIDNAIKYTGKGSIELSLSEENPDKFLFAIIDTGKGMSEEYQSRIFDQFSQEEGGYTRHFEGSGLGLSLVKKYCDIINADISVESSKDKGTTFRILLKSINEN